MIAPAAPTPSANGNGQANGRPKQLGEISGRQGWPGGVGGYRGGWCGVPGGSVINPLNFPGWGGDVDHYATGLGWGGNYFVYRWMLRHPMVQSVRGKVFNRAIASKWTIDAPNEDVRKWFETALIARREAYFAEALRSLDYGHSCFEAVWEQDDDGYYCVRFKPLWVDWTTIAEDFGGGFLGFNVAERTDLTDAQRKALDAMKAPAAGDAPGLMRPNLPAGAFKALLVTYDGEAGSLYGCPPLESAKDTVWKPWLKTAQDIMRLGGKLSERQAYAVVPPGGYTDGDGSQRTFRDDAKDAVGMHARGECPILVKPMPDPGTTDAETVAAFGGKSFVEFGTVDYGSNASAVQYLTELLSYYDGLFFHAYQQSPRAGMESTHGSRADSEQHTETDTLFVERIARLMTAPVQPFVDEMARLNFGLKKGAVVLKQMDINDPLLQFKQSVYNALVLNTATGPTVAKGIGLTQLQNDVGVPVNTSLKPGDLEKMLVDDQQAAADAKMQAAKAALAAKGNNAPPGTPPGKSVAMGRDSGVGTYGDPGYFRTIGGEPVFFHVSGGSGGRGFTRPGEASSYSVHTTAGTHTFTHREATAGHEANHTHPDGTTETATHATAGAARRDIAERAAAVEESARAAGTHLETRAKVEAAKAAGENGGMETPNRPDGLEVGPQKVAANGSPETEVSHPASGRKFIVVSPSRQEGSWNKSHDVFEVKPSRRTPGETFRDKIGSRASVEDAVKMIGGKVLASPAVPPPPAPAAPQTAVPPVATGAKPIRLEARNSGGQTHLVSTSAKGGVAHGVRWESAGESHRQDGGSYVHAGKRVKNPPIVYHKMRPVEVVADDGLFDHARDLEHELGKARARDVARATNVEGAQGAGGSATAAERALLMLRSHPKFKVPPMRQD